MLNSLLYYVDMKGSFLFISELITDNYPKDVPLLTYLAYLQPNGITR